MQFSISQIARAADLQPGLLSAETAAFLLLSMTEDPALGSCHPDPSRLVLEPGGAVAALPLDPATPLQVDRELRHLLRRLLSVSVGVNPRLKAVAEAEGVSLITFRAELSTALIPINRPAAQRALLRLHRRVGDVMGQTLARSEATPRPPAAESAPLVVARLPSRRFGRRPPPPPPGLTGNPPHSSAPVNPPAPLTPSAHQPWPAPPISFAALPELPESVTPFLGSLELEDRDVELPIPSEQAWDTDAALTDATARVAWQTDGESTEAELKSEPGTELAPEVREHPLLAAFPEPAIDSVDESVGGGHLTTRIGSLPPTVERFPEDVEEAAPDALPEALPEAFAEPSPLSPYLVDFRPAVSDISELLREFAPEPRPASSSPAHSLRHFAESSEHSRTPPPVSAESREPGTGDVQRRSSTLAWIASAAIVSCAVALRFSPTAALETASLVTVPEEPLAAIPKAATALLCTAQVRVETEPHAQVQLIAGSTRRSLPGPRAAFDAVACDADLRVVVHLPSAGAAGEDAEWLQVPVSQAGMRLAAETGEPVVLRMFPRARLASGRRVP